jgi:hypothetical protein
MKFKFLPFLIVFPLFFGVTSSVFAFQCDSTSIEEQKIDTDSDNDGVIDSSQIITRCVKKDDEELTEYYDFLTYFSIRSIEIMAIPYTAIMGCGIFRRTALARLK